jgi:hypothetical protein
VSLVHRIRQGLGLVAGVGAALLATLPVAAAETLFFDYGYLSRSLSVSDLETFAETGEVSSDLDSYFRLAEATPRDSGGISTGPQRTTADRCCSAGAVALYPAGGRISASVWHLHSDGRSTKWAVCHPGSSLGAASNPEGFSLLGVLQQYPTDIRIDIDTTLELAKSLGHCCRRHPVFQRCDRSAFPG